MTKIAYKKGKGLPMRAILAILLVESALLLVVFALGVAGGASYYYHKGAPSRELVESC